MNMYVCAARHPTCVCRYTKWRIITSNVKCKRTGCRFMVETKRVLERKKRMETSRRAVE